MALADLHSAAASGDLARLRQRWWLNKFRINGCNREKQTPLHLACINGHADVVQFLVNKKCKLNPCDNLNKTPLVKAVEHQHRDCAAILLEHGANHNHRSVNNNTALHFAVMLCNKSLVELLLEHGADIDAKNKLGYTPLTLAITTRCEEMVKFLLQKGADVNAQDNVHRTPLTVAAVSGNMKAIQLLLHHGAVFPESDKELYPFQPVIKMVQNEVIANKQIGSSCYETTPVIPLETPAMAESCDVSTEEAAEKKDSGPAVDQKKVSAHSIAVQLRRDILPAAAGEVKKEAGDSSWDSEPNSEVLDEEAATVHLPADVCRMFPGPSVAKECSKGTWQAAGTAKEENSGSLCNPKRLSDRIEKAINPVRRPAGKRRGAGVRSVAEECGKGILQPGGGGGAVKKEDADSPRDSEPGPKCQGKMWASEWLPAATCNRLDACSAAVEHRKDILPAAAGEVKKEAGDSSWDSESFSKIVEEVLASEQRCPADHKGAGARSAVAEHSKEGGAGEDDDSPWDSETDSEGQWKVSADVQVPAADQNRVGVSSAAVEHGKVARAEQKEHFISSSENKLPTLQGKNLQLKVDSTTQTDSEQDEKPLARQKLDKTLKKNSLERAPTGTVKTNCRKEQKLLLEKLERCKTRLKDLKEPLNKNDYYAKSGKNALKESKVIKILRNMQGHLAESLNSSATALLQLEEHFQRLDMKMARLEDTIQQQAKTIEFFETIQ